MSRTRSILCMDYCATMWAMDIWEQNSTWFHPVLDINRVAELLDIKPDTIRRYLTAERDDFPDPVDQHGNRNYWTRAAIYRHLWNAKPATRQQIPRLCPLTDDIAPATFVESEIIRTRGDIYVLHTWLPSDRRGPVGVAYSVGFRRSDGESAWHLLSLRPHLSALTLPQGPTALYLPDQPSLHVADHAGTGWYPRDVGWADLAALLHVDMPWWSAGLTDPDVMNAWRPGAPVRVLCPRYGDFTAAHIDRCRPLDDSPADRALSMIAVVTDRAIADACGLGSDGRGDIPNRRGLTHAATASTVTQSTRRLTTREVVAGLGHAIDDTDRAVRAVDTAVSFDVLLPAITGAVLMIDERACSALALEWLRRLVPAESQRHNEIGYHWVARQLFLDGQCPQQWWRDPLNPAVWAISTSAGRTYTTIGTHVPAQGRIEELSVEFAAPFFRDSSGAVFPVPSVDGTLHRTSRGASGTRVTAAILTLLDDARCDAHRCDVKAGVLNVQATRLYNAITEADTGGGFSRSDLEELRHGTAAGAALRRDIVDAELHSRHATRTQSSVPVSRV